MEDFVPGYEIPEGVGRGAKAPRGGPEEAAAGNASSAPTHSSSDLAGDEASPVDLSQDSLDRLAEIVVRKLSDRVVREIAWEVIPSVAEAIVRQRIKELEEGR